MSVERQPLFAGTFERSMDAKKRVAVPSGWLERKEGEEFFSVPHPSGRFLMVMPSVELMRWEAMFQENTAMTPRERRDAVRQFYASAHRVTTDGQGRILLPDDHCERTGLKGAVVVVGGKSRFEIWDKGRYGEEEARSRGNYERAAEEAGL
jgi:MraZ protein